MIHQYINNEIPIVLDVNSGSVHVVDQLVYDAIARMDEGKSLDETIDELKSTYGPDEIRENEAAFRLLSYSGGRFLRALHEKRGREFYSDTSIYQQ